MHSQKGLTFKILRNWCEVKAKCEIGEFSIKQKPDGSCIAEFSPEVGHYRSLGVFDDLLAAMVEANKEYEELKRGARLLRGGATSETSSVS